MTNDPTFLSYGFRLGAIPIESFISWADIQITKSENPGYPFIQLSVDAKNNTNSIPGWLKEAGASDDIDYELHIALIAGKYFKSQDLDAAIHLLFGLAVDNWTPETEMPDWVSEIYIIEDEASRNKKRAAKQLKKFLNPYHEIFKVKIRSIIGK